MLHRLILEVTKFQLSPSKRLSTVVKNIWGPSCPPCQIGLNAGATAYTVLTDLDDQRLFSRSTDSVYFLNIFYFFKSIIKTFQNLLVYDQNFWQRWWMGRG